MLLRTSLFFFVLLVVACSNEEAGDSNKTEESPSSHTGKDTSKTQQGLIEEPVMIDTTDYRLTVVVLPVSNGPRTADEMLDLHEYIREVVDSCKAFKLWHNRDRRLNGINQIGVFHESAAREFKAACGADVLIMTYLDGGMTSSRQNAKGGYRIHVLDDENSYWKALGVTGLNGGWKGLEADVRGRSQELLISLEKNMRIRCR